MKNWTFRDHEMVIVDTNFLDSVNTTITTTQEIIPEYVYLNGNLLCKDHDYEVLSSNKFEFTNTLSTGDTIIFVGKRPSAIDIIRKRLKIE